MLGWPFDPTSTHAGEAEQMPVASSAAYRHRETGCQEFHVQTGPVPCVSRQTNGCRGVDAAEHGAIFLTPQLLQWRGVPADAMFAPEDVVLLSKYRSGREIEQLQRR